MGCRAPSTESTTSFETPSTAEAEATAEVDSSSIIAFRDPLKKAGYASDDSSTSEVPELIIEPDPLATEDFVGSTEGGLTSQFSDEAVDPDLLAALLSFGIQDNEKENQQDDTNLTAPTDNLSSSPLPDIELDFGDDNFLIEPDQLEDIFADDQEQDWEDDDYLGGPIHLVDDLNTQAVIDQDTEDLYKDLANLSLQVGGGDTDKTMAENDDGNDGLSPYLFCQPCTPNSEALDPLSSVLASISEEEPLADLDGNRQSYLVAAAQEMQAVLEQDPGAIDLLQLDDNDEVLQETKEYTTLRPEVQEASIPFIDAFGLVDQSEQNSDLEAKSKERACYTHRETIYGVTFSPCGKFCASASQDSTICIWNVKTNALLTQFKDHSKAYECLRVAWASDEWANQILDRTSIRKDFAHLVASSGADGVVKLWACPDPLERKDEWECVYTLDHSAMPVYSSRSKGDAAKEDGDTMTDIREEVEEKKDEDKPQTYALQFIDNWKAFNTGQAVGDAQNSFLMTSSDDFIHFWELETSRPSESVEIIEGNIIRMVPDKIELKEVMSLHFGELDVHGYGVSVCSVTGTGLPLPPAPQADDEILDANGIPFGGHRNPDHKVFVFDASYCQSNGLLGAALSDGSLRLINGRGVCISVLNLPGCQSHLTSFCWDSTGTRLATSVATGHLITWNLQLGDIKDSSRSVATCDAVMEGGHQLGRPLFGSRYCGVNENLLISWCSDGSLCLWDSSAQGNIHSPIAILRSNADYPIYAVELSGDTIAVGGGTGDGGFVGTPFYLYTFDGIGGKISRNAQSKRPPIKTGIKDDAPSQED